MAPEPVEQAGGVAEAGPSVATGGGAAAGSGGSASTGDGPATAPPPDRPPSAADLYTAVRPAIVTVWCGGARGTGFLYERGDQVITAAHVVHTGRPIRVVPAIGPAVDATIVHLDPDGDVAVLALAAPFAVARGSATPPGATGAETRSAPTPLHRSREPDQPGAPVFVLGNGHVGPEALDGLLGGGRIAQVHGDALRIDVAVLAGESGAPLLDEAGGVLGVVVRRLRGVSIGEAAAIQVVEFLALEPPAPRWEPPATLTLGSSYVATWQTGAAATGAVAGAAPRLAVGAEGGVAWRSLRLAVELRVHADADGADGSLVVRPGVAIPLARWQDVALTVSAAGGGTWDGGPSWLVRPQVGLELGPVAVFGEVAWSGGAPLGVGFGVGVRR